MIANKVLKPKVCSEMFLYYKIINKREMLLLVRILIYSSTLGAGVDHFVFISIKRETS